MTESTAADRNTASDLTSDAAAPVPRFQRAWLVAFAAFVVFFVQSGLAGYVLGVLQPSWLAEFGWPQVWLSSVYAVGSLLPGLTGVIVGRWTDRFGSRWIVIIGAFGLGLSFVLLSGVHSFAMFCVAFGIGAVGRCGVSHIPVTAAVARAFGTRRALAIGLASTGISLAGVILVPFTAWLILTFGWRTAVAVLGVGTWLLVIPVVWAFMGGPAVQHGSRSSGSSGRQDSAARVSTMDATLSTALHDVTFWLIAAGQMFGMSGTLSIGIHAQKAIIDKGVSVPEAAAAISLLASCALFSRFFYSWIGDVLPAAPLLAGSYVLQGCGFAILALTGPGAGIWLFAAVLGFSLGGSVALQSVVVAELFGVRGYGAILGALGLPSGIMSALSPVIAASVYDLTGAYTFAFLGFAVVALFGAVCLAIAYQRTRALSIAG